LPSLPPYIVNSCSVNTFQNNLDKFSSNQEVNVILPERKTEVYRKTSNRSGPQIEAGSLIQAGGISWMF